MRLYLYSTSVKKALDTKDGANINHLLYSQVLYFIINMKHFFLILFQNIVLMKIYFKGITTTIAITFFNDCYIPKECNWNERVNQIIKGH